MGNFKTDSLQEGAADVVQKCIDVTINNGRMCMQHPEIFANLNPQAQFFNIINDEYSNRGTFQSDPYVN